MPPETPPVRFWASPLLFPGRWCYPGQFRMSSQKIQALVNTGCPTLSRSLRKGGTQECPRVRSRHNRSVLLSLGMPQERGAVRMLPRSLASHGAGRRRAAAHDPAARSHHRSPWKAVRVTASAPARQTRNHIKIEWPTLPCSVRKGGRPGFREYESAVKIRTQQRDVILSQAADEFVTEVIGGGCYRVAVALLVGRPALVDIFLEPVV